MKRIPIAAAKRLGQEYSQDQVIIVTWGRGADRGTSRTHVVTWGKTKKDCQEAAEGGKIVMDSIEKKKNQKDYIGWIECKCGKLNPPNQQYCRCGNYVEDSTDNV